jgi:hypothetical protein
MSANDEKAVEPWRKVNAELDGTLKRLMQLKSMQAGGGKGNPAAAPAAPVGAFGGQVVLNKAKANKPKGQNWMTPDLWDKPVDPLKKARGYQPLVEKALRAKENELLGHKDNALTRKRFQGMWSEYGEIRNRLESGVPIGDEEARQATEQMQALLERIKKVEATKPIKIIVDIIERKHTMLMPGGKEKSLSNGAIGMPSSHRGGPKFRAAGGPVSPSSPYIVGETGRELFIPNTGGYVVNATDTRRLLSGGRQPSTGSVTSTSNSFSSSVNIGSIHTASVDVAELQRAANWRQKASKARMGY